MLEPDVLVAPLAPATLDRRCRPAVAVAGLACVAGVAVTALLVIDRDPGSHVVTITMVEVIEVPVVQPAPPAPPAQEPTPTGCFSSAMETELPIEKWTMSEAHFGPFNTCEPIDLALVKRVMPGYEITQVPADQVAAMGMPMPGTITIKQRGRDVLTIWPADADAGRELMVFVKDRRFETPWRIRVGDSLGTLRGRHRNITCVYGGNEWGEHLSCFRTGPGDGWVDTFHYSLDLSPFGPFMNSDGTFNPRAFFQDDSYHQNYDRLHHLRIASITWSPAKR